MSLPAGQQRVLHGIEGALRAGEPQLASMFAIFAQLHQDEPVGAERLKRGRLSWSRPGTAMSAVVLIPVMFAAVIIGALLSGNARGAATCETRYAAGGATGLMHRPICPRVLASGSGQPNSKTPASTAPASTAPAGRAAVGTASAGDSACTTAVPAPRFTTVGSDSLAVPPLARAGTGTAHPPRMC